MEFAIWNFGIMEFAIWNFGSMEFGILVLYHESTSLEAWNMELVAR